MKKLRLIDALIIFVFIGYGIVFFINYENQSTEKIDNLIIKKIRDENCFTQTVCVDDFPTAIIAEINLDPKERYIDKYYFSNKYQFREIWIIENNQIRIGKYQDLLAQISKQHRLVILFNIYDRNPFWFKADIAYYYPNMSGYEEQADFTNIGIMWINIKTEIIDLSNK
jgi:hypothetical protein